MRYTGKCLLKTGSLKWKPCSAAFADFPDASTLNRAEFEQHETTSWDEKNLHSSCWETLQPVSNTSLKMHFLCFFFFSFPFFYWIYKIFFILIYFFCWNGSYTFYVVNLVMILEFFNMQIDLTTDQYVYFPLEYFKES